MNISTQCEFDLIGQEVTISDSKNNEIIGINGKIIMETKNIPNIRKIHKFIAKKVVDIVNAAQAQS